MMALMASALDSGMAGLDVTVWARDIRSRVGIRSNSSDIPCFSRSLNIAALQLYIILGDALCTVYYETQDP